MTDKQYKKRMEEIAIKQEIFIASVKAHQQLAHVEWLGIMGLMETWDLISD